MEERAWCYKFLDFWQLSNFTSRLLPPIVLILPFQVTRSKTTTGSPSSEVYIGVLQAPLERNPHLTRQDSAFLHAFLIQPPQSRYFIHYQSSPSPSTPWKPSRDSLWRSKRPASTPWWRTHPLTYRRWRESLEIRRHAARRWKWHTHWWGGVTWGARRRERWEGCHTATIGG